MFRRPTVVRACYVVVIVRVQWHLPFATFAERNSAGPSGG